MFYKKLKSNIVFRAGFWSLSSTFFSQLIRLVNNLLLTRILAPELFGLMAVVNVLVAGAALLSDIGISQSIIQSKNGEQKKFLDTAWSIQIIRGLIIWVVLCVIAFLVWAGNELVFFNQESVYSDSKLPMVIIIVGLTSMISGFNSTAIHLYRRKLLQGRLVLLELSVQTISAVITLCLALILESIWALVLGNILSSLFTLAYSHLLLDSPRNQWCWNKKHVSELFNFGRWIFLSTAIGFLGNQGDKLVMGGLLSAEFLGVFTIASVLAAAPTMLVSRLTHQVLYPKYSHTFRNAPDKLTEVFHKSRLWLGFLVLPMIGVLINIGDEIVLFLYDERYADAGWILQFLALGVAISCILIPASLLLMAKGKPQYSTVSASLKAIYVVTVIPYVYNSFGVELMVLALAISGLIDIPVLWYGLIKHHNFMLRTEFISLCLVFFGWSVAELMASLVS